MPPFQQFAASLSPSARLDQAAREVAAVVRQQLAGPPTLAVAFASSLYEREELEALPALLCDLLATENLIGATGESIVGVGREVEEGPALSLWAAHLPAARIDLMNLDFARAPDGGVFQGWPAGLQGEWPANSTLLLLGEPFSFPAEALLEQLNDDRPGMAVLGGMASGGTKPGDHRLFYGRRALASGAVGTLISGEVAVRALVSQGCRPIGKPFVVTRAERNIVFELGGKPALEQLRNLFAELPNSEKALVQRGLHLGRVVNEYQDRFEPGDFLVRNVTGFDPQHDALAVGDYFRTGQTVQFHVRDAQSADDDLRTLLRQCQADCQPAAALLFTCNGRGERLFGVPHHDAGLIERELGSIPLAGLFAAGEIGPIGGRNFLHGFTASAAIFESSRPA